MKQFGLVLDGTWCDGRGNPLMRNSLEEVSNVQKTNQRATNKNRKEGLKSHDDITARLVPTLCHHKLPTTIATLLTSHYLLCG